MPGRRDFLKSVATAGGLLSAYSFPALVKACGRHRRYSQPSTFGDYSLQGPQYNGIRAMRSDTGLDDEPAMYLDQRFVAAGGVLTVYAANKHPTRTLAATFVVTRPGQTAQEYPVKILPKNEVQVVQIPLAGGIPTIAVKDIYFTNLT
jgi:hypothetical protein